MNCDFIDLKQETINCKGGNLENHFFSCICRATMTTIPISLIQLHYFDDVINDFNLIDLDPQQPVIA